MTQVRYLCDEDVVACGLGHRDVAQAVRDILVAKGRGQAVTRRKLSLPGRGATSFSAKGGAWLERGYAAVKWYGYARDNAPRRLPDFHPLLLLSDDDTGMPVAIIDGRWISSVRTAAISAVAADALALPQSSAIGFVACGAQARAHLEAFHARFPLRRVDAYSRSGRSAARLVEKARAMGLDAHVAANPREAVEGQDIVITSIPRMSEPREYLDAGWIAPGAFVSMVDLGFSWDRDTLARIDFAVTDDLDPVTREPTETLNYAGVFGAELCELLVAPPHGAVRDHGRKALIFGGTGLADVAVAVIVHDRAVERGLGRMLPL